VTFPTNHVIKSAIYKTKPLNILWFPYNGLFEHLLFQGSTHKFYGCIQHSYIKWDTTLYNPGSNFHPLQEYKTLPISIDFDLIVCNDRLEQYSYAQQLSDVLHLPLLIIEHTSPMSIMKLEDIFLIEKQQQPDFTVVVNDIINKSWNKNYHVIKYGIPNIDITDKLSNKKTQAIIIGQFSQSEYAKLYKIINTIKIPILIIGDNKDISNTMSYDQTIKILSESRFVINIGKQECYPLTLYLGMAAGCIPIAATNNFINQ